VKNKIQNSSNCYRKYLLCTNLTKPKLTQTFQIP